MSHCNKIPPILKLNKIEHAKLYSIKLLTVLTAALIIIIVLKIYILKFWKNNT